MFNNINPIKIMIILFIIIFGLIYFLVNKLSKSLKYPAPIGNHYSIRFNDLDHITKKYIIDKNNCISFIDISWNIKTTRCGNYTILKQNKK